MINAVGDRYKYRKKANNGFQILFRERKKSKLPGNGGPFEIFYWKNGQARIIKTTVNIFLLK